MTIAHGLACPTCPQGTITPGTDASSRCATCGHVAATAFVRDALGLDAWMADATARRAWLGERIAASDPAPGLTSPQPAAQHATVTAPSGQGARQVLYVLGGLLLTGAAVFFFGVAWALMPDAARPILVAVVGAALIGGGEAAARRALRGLGETLATVGYAISVGAALAAPELLGLADNWSDVTSIGWVAAMFMAAAALGSARAVVSVLSTWNHVPVLAAGLAAAFTAALVADAVGADQWQAPWVLVILVGVAIVAALPALTRGHRVTAALTATGLAAAAPAAALWSFGHQRYADVAIIGAAVAVIALVTSIAQARPKMAVVAAGGAGVAVTFAAAAAFPLAAPVIATTLAVAATMAATAVPAKADGAVSHWPWLAAAAAAATSALALTVVTAQADVAAYVLLMATLVLLAASQFGRTSGATWRSLALLAAITGPAAWVTWWQSSVWAVAPWSTFENTTGTFAVETRAVPAGLIAAACVAAWARRYRRDTGTAAPTTRWLTWPLSLALMPGALYGLLDAAGHYFTDDPAATRALAYLLIGSGVAAAGAAARIGGLALTGAQVTAVSAAGVVIAIATVMPGWIALALAGTVLVVAAARWEAFTLRGKRGRAWLAAMT